MKKIVIIVLGFTIFICGCAASKYKVQADGEKIFTPGLVNSDSYTVETGK